VGYLHSYTNPSHELSTLEVIKDLVPQASVSLSSRVCPEIREYERLSTTVANAYIKPLMAEYLESLELQLRSRGVRCPLLLMTSGGGLTTLDTAKDYPIRLVESGPAGGAILAEQLSKELNEPSLVSFDMGGTTAKICLIDQGSANHSRSFEVDRAYRFKKGSGLPLRIPVIEMVEIGAGGGSMSRVDPMKRIQVGPQSAGSDPGPVCYGRGGEVSTVSDADAVMGKLYPKFFAGGDLTLDVDAAKFAIEEQIGASLGLDVFAAANSVAEVVDENMVAAAKAHSSEWGKTMDARALVAFGGAAPLHAANLAKKLKISRLYIPQGAGVGSALGFLLAPARFEVVRSFFSPLKALNMGAMVNLIEEMRNEATGVVSQMSSGPVDEKVRAYIRYKGQGHEVSVLVDQVELADADYLRERFESAYRETYGRILEEVEAEILSWTLSLEGAAQREEWFEFKKSNAVVETQIGESNVYMSDAELKTPVLWREALEEGEEYLGPLLITENQTTTVVPKHSSVSITQQGVLRITLGLQL
ncbi:MAG: hydantoinase/oxoprolinase family protein, partial [Candidatus Azotimanducaceae bacterium]